MSPKCITKVAHLFVAICCLFHPHTHINERDGGEGGNCPSRMGGSTGGGEARGTVFVCACSSICTCKIGLNCNEMLLPANTVWNFVVFAHLPYL